MKTVCPLDLLHELIRIFYRLHFKNLFKQDLYFLSILPSQVHYVKYLSYYKISEQNIRINILHKYCVYFLMGRTILSEIWQLPNFICPSSIAQLRLIQE